jgi:hypothetical protein
LTSVVVDVVTPVVAAVAAVAGVGSWRASAKANKTGGGLAAIERGRRHDEVTPEFEITCRERGMSGDSADMRVSLKRGKLEGLEEVTITILDEMGREHGSGLPHRFTEEAEAFVWGPWEFNTGASAQVISNRTTRARPYSHVTGKNWDLLSMARTRPASWMTGTSQDDWRRQTEDQPIRLLITCRREGYEPWLVPYEIMVEPDEAR